MLGARDGQLGYAGCADEDACLSVLRPRLLFYSSYASTRLLSFLARCSIDGVLIPAYCALGLQGYRIATLNHRHNPTRTSVSALLPFLSLSYSPNSAISFLVSFWRLPGVVRIPCFTSSWCPRGR